MTTCPVQGTWLRPRGEAKSITVPGGGAQLQLSRVLLGSVCEQGPTSGPGAGGGFPEELRVRLLI